MAHMALLVQHIAEHPEHIWTLAKWFQEEWDYQHPELTIEARARELELKQSTMELPMTLIAFRDGQLVGTYSLDLDDMTTHRHLSPWLANVYVAEPFRGRGIGTLLMKDGLVRAKELKIPTLYLLTADLADWYESFGWQTIEKVMYCGELETVMRIEL